MDNKNVTNAVAILRQQAEEVLQHADTLHHLALDDPRRMLYTMSAYQVELEVQNEALRQMQQELHDSYNRYRNLYDFTPVGYFTLDVNKVITEVNLTGAVLLGSDRAHLLHTPFAHTIPAEDQDIYYLHQRRLMTEKVPQVSVLRLHRTDGSWFHARLESTLIDPAEPQAGCRVVISDITQLIEAEEALRRAYDELEQRVQERTAQLVAANAALGASEVRFRAMAETMPGIVFTIQPDGNYDYVSPQFSTYTGMPTETALGPGWPTVMHPDDVPHALARSHPAFTHGEPHENRYRLRRADGVYRWFVSRTRPLHAADGAIIKWIGVATDVDDLKQVQAVLRESELRFRTMAETIPSIVFTGRPDGACDYVNEQFYRYTGMPPGSALGTGWKTAMHPDDRTATAANWQDAFKRGDVYEGEYRLRRADGTYRWFVSRVQALHDQVGNIVQWIGASTDIDDLKRTQEALCESEARFRVVLQNSPITVFNHDTELRYTWVYNPPLHFTVADMLGKTDADLFAPASAMRLMTLKRQVLTTGTEVHTAVEVTAHNTTYWYDLKAEPLRNAAGTVIGITCAATNITEHQRTLETHRLLSEVSRQLALSLDVTTSLQDVARLLVTQLADVCTIDILAEDGYIQPLVMTHRDGFVPPADCPRAQLCQLDANSPHPFARILWHNESLCWNTVTDEHLRTITQNEEQLAQLRALAISSYIGVPLIARGQRIGVLCIMRTHSEHQFDEQDMGMVEEIARRTALAFDNARLFAAEQQARHAAEQAAERTARLQRVTAALMESNSFERVADIIVEQGIAALGAYAGTVVLLSEQGTQLQLLRAHGYEENWQERWQSIDINEPAPMTTTVLECTPVWLESRAAFAARYPNVNKTSSRSHAWATLPLVLSGRVIGGLGFSFTEERSFRPEDRAFMLSLALQCAQALDRARLHENEQRARAQAEAALTTRDQVFRLISHDLRSPLTTIQGYAHLLQRRLQQLALPETDQLTRGLSHITSSTTRMAGLIQELLDVASLQAGKTIALTYGSLDLLALLHQVVEDNAHLSSRHTLQVRTTYNSFQ